MSQSQSTFNRVKALCEDSLSKSKDLQGPTVVALAIKVVAALLGFGTQVFLAQLLNVEEYGVYSYFWVFVMVGGFVTSLGLSESGTRFIAEYRDTDKHNFAWGFIQSSVLWVVGVASILAVVGMLLAFAFESSLPEGYVVLICLTLLCVPVFALQDLTEGFAVAFSWMGLAHIPPFVLRQLLVIVFMLLLLALSLPATATTALIAVLLAGLVATTCQLAIFLKRAHSVMPRQKSAHKRALWIKTSLPMFFANGFQLCLTMGDVVILGMFVDSSMVALYFAATRLSSQVVAVQFAVTSAVAQRFSSFNATDRREELFELIHTSTRWIFWPTLLVTLGLLVVGWPLLWLFGPEFTEAYPLLPILALGLLVRASTGGAEDVLNMTGHERAEFVAKAGSTVLNLALNFTLIPWYGIYGAAIATTVSIIVYSIVIEAMVRRFIGTSSFVGTLGWTKS